MKKILLLIVSMFCFISITNASGISVNISCPETASPSSTVSCTINATPSTSWYVCAFQVKYTITNATFDSFTKNSIFTGGTNANGAVLNIDNVTDCFSGSTSIGTLKVTMPSSGTASIIFKEIEGTDDTGNESSSASDVTKTIRVKSNDATLSSLTLSNGTLSPTFSSSTTDYTATIDAASTVISADKSNTYASINGTGTKTINYGNNVFIIVVTAEDGSTKTYKITINRPDNRDTINTLSKLTLNNGTLSPTFSSANLTYTATVASTITKTTVTATLTSNKSSFVSGYGSREVNLEYGSNKIEVKVKSENDVVRIYSIYVTRTDNRSSDNYLKSLSLDNATINFSKNVTEYAVTVNYNIETMNITGTVNDSKSTVRGLGVKNLNVGANIINIVVTAENSATKTYKITITRLSQDETPSSNTNLTSLTITNHDFSFTSDKTEYDIKLEDDEDILDLSYITEDTKSVVTVTGNENLKNGSIVTVTVTSTDGTIKVYKLNIVKSSSNLTDTMTSTNDSSYKIEWSKELIISLVSIIVILGIIITAIVIHIKRKKNSEI